MLATIVSGTLAGCLSNSDSTDPTETETTATNTLRTASGTASEPVSNSVRSDVSGLSIEETRVIESDDGKFQVAAEIRNMVVESVVSEVSLTQYNKTFAVYDSDGNEISTETTAETSPDGYSLETDETGTVLFTAVIPEDSSVARYEILINCNLEPWQDESELC